MLRPVGFIGACSRLLRVRVQGIGSACLALDADVDLFTDAAKADRVVVHLPCGHRDCGVPHETRHRLDVHAPLDQ
jgi:hypothetical protein